MMSHPLSSHLPSPSSPSSSESTGFDQILKQLRQIVSQLEQGNLSLEQALVAFEEGVRLSRKGAEFLDQAEHRVELLTRDDKGDLQIQPLSVDVSPK